MMKRRGFVTWILAALGGTAAVSTGKPLLAENNPLSGHDLPPPAPPTWSNRDSARPPPCPKCGGSGYVRATPEEVEKYGWAAEPEPKGPRPKRQHVTLRCPECNLVGEFVRTYPRKSIPGLMP